MAEKIATHLFPEKVIAGSAGTFHSISMVDMDAETTTVMQEIGIDISKHQPKYFTRVEGEWDIVVNMSPDAKSWIIAQKPSLLSARWTRWNITDPRGRHTSIYRNVRDELLQRIQKLMRKI